MANAKHVPEVEKVSKMLDIIDWPRSLIDSHVASPLSYTVDMKATHVHSHTVLHNISLLGVKPSLHFLFYYSFIYLFGTFIYIHFYVHFIVHIFLFT